MTAIGKDADETAVTPEMVEAGLSAAHLSGDIRMELGRNGLPAIYLAMKALDPEIERLREALHDWRNSWLCPVGHFDGQRLLRVTDSALRLTPIIGEYDD